MNADRKPPAAPLYFDCVETEAGACVLRWGAPEPQVGGDPITNTVLEYRGGEGGDWQSVDGLVLGHKHTFYGEKFYKYKFEYSS